jgi:large subunit ribosomal protein L1
MALPTPIQLDEKILVFTVPENKELAVRSGADIVGGEELLNDLLENRLSFDRVVATTDMVPLVTKLARILGPRGLMPSVKTGTLTTDLSKALSDIRSKVPFRIEKFTGVFNVPVAKVNYLRLSSLYSIDNNERWRNRGQHQGGPQASLVPRSTRHEKRLLY